MLASQHELEAVEVVHLGASLLDGELLGPAALVPLALKVALSHSRLQGLLAGTTHDVALEVGEGQPADGHLLTLDAGVGAVDQDAVVVDDVNDDDGLVGLGTIGDLQNEIKMNTQTEILHLL